MKTNNTIMALHDMHLQFHTTCVSIKWSVLNRWKIFNNESVYNGFIWIAENYPTTMEKVPTLKLRSSFNDCARKARTYVGYGAIYEHQPGQSVQFGVQTF